MQYNQNSHLPISARSAGVIILDSQKRMLLMRENLLHKADLWHIPADSVEEDESLEHAAIREAKKNRFGYKTGCLSQHLCWAFSQ